MNKRNDVGRWIILALVCGSASGGATFLRPHNPAITTEAWIKLQLDVEALDDKITVLSEEFRALMRRMPQQPP